MSCGLFLCSEKNSTFAGFMIYRTKKVSKRTSGRIGFDLTVAINRDIFLF